MIVFAALAQLGLELLIGLTPLQRIGLQPRYRIGQHIVRREEHALSAMILGEHRVGVRPLLQCARHGDAVLLLGVATIDDAAEFVGAPGVVGIGGEGGVDGAPDPARSLSRGPVFFRRDDPDIANFLSALIAEAGHLIFAATATTLMRVSRLLPDRAPLMERQQELDTAHSSAHLLTMERDEVLVAHGVNGSVSLVLGQCGNGRANWIDKICFGLSFLARLKSIRDRRRILRFN